MVIDKSHLRFRVESLAKSSQGFIELEGSALHGHGMAM
jgi:hypothetical protein